MCGLYLLELTKNVVYFIEVRGSLPSSFFLLLIYFDTNQPVIFHIDLGRIDEASRNVAADVGAW